MTTMQAWVLITCVGGCAMWLGVIAAILHQMHERQSATALTNAIAKGLTVPKGQARRTFSR